MVKWIKRWMWPFEVYMLPVFETAKDLGIRLVALNVDSEALSKAKYRDIQDCPQIGSGNILMIHESDVSIGTLCVCKLAATHFFLNTQCQI
jgi:hypothetical protein